MAVCAEELRTIERRLIKKMCLGRPKWIKLGMIPQLSKSLTKVEVRYVH